VSADAPASPPAGSSGFSPRVVLALLLAGVFAMAAFLALSAYAPDLRAKSSGGVHALSTSAVGYAGAVRLLGLVGQPVGVSRSAARVRTFPGLMVLTPLRPGQLNSLDLQRDRLIVLPKWRSAPDPDHPGWAAQVAEAPEILAARVLPPSLGAVTVERRAAGAAGPSTLVSDLGLWPAEGASAGPVQRFQTLAGGKLTPLVKDEQGREVVGMAPGGHVYVLSDPDLLNTRGLADPRTARIALMILLALRDDGQPIAFDVSLDGVGGERNLLRLAIEPPFLGATLCLALAAALIGVQAWGRFGPARRADRAVALGKTALVENGAGMILLARREPAMARRYVRLCRQRAAAALGAGRLRDDDLDAFLDRWAEREGAEDRITALQAEAARVKTLGDLMTLAQRTRRWRLEMTREPG
jgi:hypothetical protein